MRQLLSMPIAVAIGHLNDEPQSGPKRHLRRIGIGYLVTHALFGSLRVESKKNTGEQALIHVERLLDTGFQVRSGPSYEV